MRSTFSIKPFFYSLLSVGCTRRRTLIHLLIGLFDRLLMKHVYNSFRFVQRGFSPPHFPAFNATEANNKSNVLCLQIK